MTSSSGGTIALTGTGPRGSMPPRISPYWMLVLPLVLFLLILYVYPIGQVLWISFSDPSPGLQNYERLFTTRGIRRMLLTTLKICTVTTLLSMLFGYLIAYAMAHVTDRHRMWILMFVLVPFWVSVLARAFSWVVLLQDNGLINRALIDMGVTSEPLSLVRNQFGVIVGMTHYMIPYAVLPLYANLRGIDGRLVSAARGLGAGPFEAFLRVYLPLSLPGLAAAGLLVFILTLGFFVTPTILGGGKTVMIAEYVSVQILQTVRWGVGSMLAVVLLLVVFLIFAVMSRVIDLRLLFGAK